MADFSSLLPGDLGVGVALVLIATSFVTSALTAAFGVGGGLTLLAVMASVLPLTSVVPVHGVVQMGSNAGRAVVLRRFIHRPETLVFLAGSAVGALVGGFTVTALPDAPLKIAVGVFVLALMWGRAPPGLGSGLGSGLARSKAAMAIGGAFGGALTMAFGATGPFTAALLQARALSRQALSATFAACMTGQHAIKVVIFIGLGFAFAAWVPLMAAMIAAGVAGTLVGAKVLHALPERVFARIFQALLTLLALRLVVTGALDVLAG